MSFFLAFTACVSFFFGLLVFGYAVNRTDRYWGIVPKDAKIAYFLSSILFIGSFVAAWYA